MVVVMLMMTMTMVMVTMVVDLHWFQIQIHPLSASARFVFFQFKVILDCNGCFHVRNAFVFALEDFSINGFRICSPPICAKNLALATFPQSEISLLCLL